MKFSSNGRQIVCGGAKKEVWVSEGDFKFFKLF